jgi:hypothetical protein
MAKKATAKADGSGKRAVARTSKPSGSGENRKRSSQSQSEGLQSDVVDALIKLLQSPLVIDLLAVGATAALAAITEHRSSREQGAVRNPKRALKAAGKAAASAVGRRLANEFDEIKGASKRAAGESKTRADATA